MTETPTDDETRRVDLPTDDLTHVEATLKTRMAEVLPMAATDDAHFNSWEQEYASLARSLRRVLKAAGREARVRVLDYPTGDGDRLWHDLDVDPGTDDTYVVTIAYSEGSA